jgi:hypothetical protein
MFCPLNTQAYKQEAARIKERDEVHLRETIVHRNLDLSGDNTAPPLTMNTRRG